MFSTSPVYTPRRPHASNIDLHSQKTELILIHFTMWLLFLPCSAPAKILLNYMFKKHFYGRNVVETRSELSANTGLTVRQIRDIIRELTKINYIFHDKLSGQLSELTLNLPVIESDRDKWIATSQILGRGTADERQARANQVISIPQAVIFANNKGVALAAGLVSAYDAFFLNIYTLSRESGINIACIKLALKIAVQSGGYELKQKCYYANKEKLPVFWQVLTHTINAIKRNKTPIEKNDVPEDIRARKQSSAETTAQQGLQANHGHYDESSKMTSPVNTQSSISKEPLTNNYRENYSTFDKNKKSNNKNTLTVQELAQHFAHNNDAFEHINAMIESENRLRPRMKNFEVSIKHVQLFLQYWANHESPRKCKIEGWMRLLEGWLKSQNAFCIVPDYVPHAAICACKTEYQVSQLERAEASLALFGIELGQYNGEDIEVYILRKVNFAVFTRLQHLVGPFNSFERHMFIMLGQFLINPNFDEIFASHLEKTYFFIEVQAYFEACFSASNLAILEPSL